MTAPNDNLQVAAGRLRAAWATGQPCAPVRDLLGDDDLAAAYAVQDFNTRHWIVEGRRPVGRKIGLTARAVQVQLGADEPIHGMLYADMEIPEGGEVPFGRAMQPKAEAEVAFVLGADLDEERLTVADVMSAIDYAVAAIEVVASRIADWNVRLTDTVADNASGGLFVLGREPRRLGEFDPRQCGMVMEIGGEPVSVGGGAACLGNPIDAVRWLAMGMAIARRPLRRGDIILSGALGPMAAVKPGDAVEARIGGLGAVGIRFAGNRTAV